MESFLRFRFEYAALVYDATKAARSHGFCWHARIVAGVICMLMLVLPALSLIIGDGPVGNKYWFAATLVLWPYILESPGWEIRQKAAWPAKPPAPDRGFDAPRFVVLSVLAVVALAGVGLFEDDIRAVKNYGDELLGITWGVTFAGMLDLTRTLAAYSLTFTGGYPMYGNRSWKTADEGGGDETS